MKIEVMKKYNTNVLGSYQGTKYLIVIGKHASIRWFTDCGEWFVYIVFGSKWWRFSGAGYMKGKSVLM